MTITPTVPDVPLPAGVADADIWEDDDRPYRIIHGAGRGITDRANVLVGTTAVQYLDGTVDDGAIHEAPSVYVYIDEGPLTSAQARELAAVIVECADEIDRWAARAEVL